MKPTRSAPRGDEFLDSSDHLGCVVFALVLVGQRKSTTLRNLGHHQKHGLDALRGVVIPAPVWGRLVLLVYDLTRHGVGNFVLADGRAYDCSLLPLSVCRSELLLRSSSGMASLLGRDPLQL